MVRVLVVSDSPVVRAGLRAMLDGSDRFQVVGEASIEEVSTEAPELQPDVALVDALGGERDEMESLWRLGAESPDLGIVVLSGNPSESLAREALQAGVRGYLLRDASAEEIAATLEAVNQGLTVLHPTTARALIPHTEPAPRAPADEILSSRELEVLRLLAQGLPSKTIASRLHISEHTVKFHVGSILAKLGASSRTEAVSLALRKGLIAL